MGKCVGWRVLRCLMAHLRSHLTALSQPLRQMEDNCSICLGALHDKPHIALECHQAFHCECIVEALRRCTACPLCRADPHRRLDSFAFLVPPLFAPGFGASPAFGPGFQMPAFGQVFEAPPAFGTDGPGYQMPAFGPGFERPPAAADPLDASSAPAAEHQPEPGVGHPALCDGARGTWVTTWLTCELEEVDADVVGPAEKRRRCA